LGGEEVLKVKRQFLQFIFLQNLDQVMGLIEIRKVGIAAHRADQSSETGCVLSQILNVVAKPHAFDIMHICPYGFKFTAEFYTALDHWRRIGKLI
jgi:hypothetical protein